MGKIAIVIGATGLVGRALVDQLAEATHISKVITVTRQTAEHASVKVVNHVVNFDCLQDHAPLFKGDYLFSCLGTTLKQAGTVEAQRLVDVDYQLQVAQIAVNNGVKDYFLVSSTGANADSARPYLKMKGELEQKVRGYPLPLSLFFNPLY